MHEVMFILDPEQPQDLAQVAKRVFLLLGLSETEERESSNYVEGRYFIGYASNASVEVCHSDGAELEQYRFWVVLQDHFLRKSAQRALVAEPEHIAKELAAGGLEVLIPSGGWGRVGWVPSGKLYGAFQETHHK